MKSDYVRAHFELGMVYAWQGKMDQAISSYQSVVALIQHPDERWAMGSMMRPNDSADLLEKSFNNIGSALFTKGDFVGAVINFSKALSLNSRYSDAYFHRGLAYRQMGRAREALRDFRSACGLGHEAGCVEAHD